MSRPSRVISLTWWTVMDGRRDALVEGREKERHKKDRGLKRNRGGEGWEHEETIAGK